MMGMPITVEIADADADPAAIDAVFGYLRSVDERFSTYKATSEITRMNDGLVRADGRSPEMREVLAKCEETARLTDGYFDIRGRDGRLDPSGLVKGWSIRNAADLLAGMGYGNFYVDAGGDVEVRGTDAAGAPWTVGIRDPFGSTGMVKVLRRRRRDVRHLPARPAHLRSPPEGRADYRHRQPHRRRTGCVRGRPFRDRGVRHGPSRHRLHRPHPGARGLSHRRAWRRHHDARLRPSCR